MTTSRRWLRVSRRTPCPICGRADWCTVSEDGTAANCPRTPNDHPLRSPRTGDIAGYLHKIDGSPMAPTARAQRARPPARSRAELENIVRRCETAISPVRLKQLAERLGVSVESLRRERIGWADGLMMWSDKRQRDVRVTAWVFPMVDERERVIGIRFRTGDGAKFSYTGGHEGLFIPRRLTGQGPLMVCEGPTSLAALLDWGFDGIGRPFCRGGVGLLIAYLQQGRRRDLVILGDHDEAKRRDDGSVFFPGQEGAEALSQEVLPYARSVKVVIPPTAKDSREWKNQGASRAVVEAIVRAANYVRNVSASEADRMRTGVRNLSAERR